MTVLSDCELADIQADVENALDKTCVIKRLAKTSDGLGTETETLSLISTTKAIVSKPSAGLLASYGERISSLITWQVQLPTSTDVRLNDHLFIENIEMIVQALLTPKSYSFLTNTLAAEVQ